MYYLRNDKIWRTPFCFWGPGLTEADFWWRQTRFVARGGTPVVITEIGSAPRQTVTCTVSTTSTVTHDVTWHAALTVDRCVSGLYSSLCVCTATNCVPRSTRTEGSSGRAAMLCLTHEMAPSRLGLLCWDHFANYGTADSRLASQSTLFMLLCPQKPTASPFPLPVESTHCPPTLFS
jgi:hypothetical protein